MIGKMLKWNMENLLDFFVEVGKLKKMRRRGWVLRGIKNPETIASHTFRVALMSWILCCKKGLDINRIIKLSLIHDICEVYAGDTTPYDRILPGGKRKPKELFERWPRFSGSEKEKFFQKKYKKEDKALKKIISSLPFQIRREIANLWDDYEKGLTREGIFVRQVDRLENLLQALEYWKEKKNFAIRPWWVQIEELIDDPILLEFMKEMEKKFHGEEKG